jgi:hypothetical protein
MIAMQPTVWLGALLLTCLPAIGAAEGLVLDFSDGPTLTLLDLSTTPRVPPAREREGATWTASAEDAQGRIHWQGNFPVPRIFDGASTLHFSVIVPSQGVGERVTIRDAHETVRWSGIVDAVRMQTAESHGRQAAREVDAAYLQTAKLAEKRSGVVKRGRPMTLPPPPAGVGVRNDRSLSPTAATTRAVESTAQNAGGPFFAIAGHADAAEVPIVRAYDASSNRFVVSTREDWITGRFDLPLESGDYRLEADENLSVTAYDGFFYRTPQVLPPLHVVQDTSLSDVPRDTAAGQFVLNLTLPCDAGYPTDAPQVWFDVSADSHDHARLQRPAWPTAALVVSANDMCTGRYVIRLSPGTYSISASPLGWPPGQRFDSVDVGSNGIVERAQTFARVDRTQVWQGRLIDDEGRPVDGTPIVLADGVQDAAGASTMTDASGHFASENSSATVVRLDESTPPATVVVHQVPFSSATDGGLLRFYGDGNRATRYNILFLAAGYAGVHETFTDANGNGEWDGYVLQDLNSNGVFDSASDQYAVHGSPSVYGLPEGASPAAYSEAFTDLNGDGVLSVDDAALFQDDARAFMRSLLGSDVWNGHADAFNAYALFEPSEQSGYSIVSTSGEPIVTRSTKYDATLDLSRHLLGVDREAAMHRALIALPELDLVVILVNEPIPGGRGNTTLAAPGSMVIGASDAFDPFQDATPAHEMAHFVAGLCDEYDEFAGVSPEHGQAIAGCPNASFSAARADIPWASLLPANATIPTRDLGPALGVYEGAVYYTGGAYRPSYASTMRNLSPSFNAPSRLALERAIALRTRSALPFHSTHAQPPFAH